jgi:hypothetical protein
MIAFDGLGCSESDIGSFWRLVSQDPARICAKKKLVSLEPPHMIMP